METEKNKIECSVYIRLSKDNKQYYEHQLKTFCEHFDENKLIAVQFGKQDMRGTESITLIDKRHCVPSQIHFYNKWEMLGFIIGFNQAKEKGHYGRFKEWLK